MVAIQFLWSRFKIDHVYIMRSRLQACWRRERECVHAATKHTTDTVSARGPIPRSVQPFYSSC